MIFSSSMQDESICPSFIEHLNQAMLPEKSKYKKLPDDDYTGVINSVQMHPDKAKIVWDFVVSSGKYHGQHVWKHQLVNKPKYVGFLAKDLKTCDVTGDLTEENFEDTLASLTGSKVKITLNTSESGYQNVCIKRFERIF